VVNHDKSIVKTVPQTETVSGVLWHTLEPGSFIRGIGLGIMIGGGLTAKYGIGLAVPMLVGSALIPFGHVITHWYIGGPSHAN
jgi:hypothetical protein